ncbi:hypothetical protein J0895_00395 [Phormidium pseudopriestleyi FRX01]|uniref:Uncharacterized protein n=1 Tax=Phormidium pseudopriestleyi FRX01 TaxID=1759528 RepID=A0ABS3FLQ9_9CYAN|nr:hypothetical protein [Phormidium pseudopriestleyi]MBO0347591.1 hypothetical protein [Phormidium pseudopriestleyi FRX01]
MANTVAEQFQAVSRIQKVSGKVSSVNPYFSLATLWIGNRRHNLSKLEGPDWMKAAREQDAPTP